MRGGDASSRCWMIEEAFMSRVTVQGYLVHKKDTPLLGPYSTTMPRVLWWSLGGGAISYERGTPVGAFQHSPPGATLGLVGSKDTQLKDTDRILKCGPQ